MPSVFSRIKFSFGVLAQLLFLGDPDYKGFVDGEVVDMCLNWPRDHSQVKKLYSVHNVYIFENFTFLKMFSADLIISEPEILSIELNSLDEFLVIATDGVWDFLTPEQAIRKTR